MCFPLWLNQQPHRPLSLPRRSPAPISFNTKPKIYAIMLLYSREEKGTKMKRREDRKYQKDAVKGTILTLIPENFRGGGKTLFSPLCLPCAARKAAPRAARAPALSPETPPRFLRPTTVPARHIRRAPAVYPAACFAKASPWYRGGAYSFKGECIHEKGVSGCIFSFPIYPLPAHPACRRPRRAQRRAAIPKEAVAAAHTKTTNFSKTIR